VNGTAPESANAATNGGDNATTGDLSTGTPSLWTQITNTLSSMANLSPDSLAQAWGLWTAARAAVNTVASGVASAATGSTIYAAQAKYTPNPLTPAALADMVVRNILPDSTGTTTATAPAAGTARMPNGVAAHSATDEAALSGISGDRFAALCYDSGESYGIMDALRLWNRGQYLYAVEETTEYATGTPIYQAGASLGTQYGITEDELDTVIYYSRTRDEFIPDLKQLSKNTISGADAVEVAVKQIMSTADATNLYAAAGGMPEQFQMLVDAAGDSAGVEKATELYAHGVITYGQLEQIIAMSRLNHRFYYLAGIGTDGPTVTEPYQAPFNQKWLPPYEIKEAASAGLVTQAQALQWMLEQGYPEDQANAFAGTIATGTVTTVKHETEGMVLDELQAGMITQADATTALTNLGYASDAIPFLLQYAQAKAVISARNSAVSRVRAGYLAGAVTADQATASLSQLDVPQAQITAFLADWAAELAVPHTLLTVAQIGKLLEESYITADQAASLWALKGYPPTDIGYLFYIYPAPTQAPSAGAAPETGTA
jgi:hypothetical protein